MALMLAMPLGWGALAPLAEASHICDPDPIGRCGAYQRESVVFCYLKVGNLYLSPTDTHVVAIGGTPPDVVSVDSGNPGLLYARLSPAEAFAGDPYDAPIPFNTLFREKNTFHGLQPKAYKCANFVWFAECEPAQWMGPFNVVDKAPDEVVL